MMENESEAKKEMGEIPLLSSAIARSKVKQVEGAVSRFRTGTTSALAAFSIQCGQAVKVDALLMEAREAALKLNPEAREPLMRRIEEAEVRMESVRSACRLPQADPQGMGESRPEEDK